MAFLHILRSTTGQKNAKCGKIRISFKIENSDAFFKNAYQSVFNQIYYLLS